MHQLDFNEQVLQSAWPVRVDYWAEWCAPCKALLPVLDAKSIGVRANICDLPPRIHQSRLFQICHLTQICAGLDVFLRPISSEILSGNGGKQEIDNHQGEHY